MLDKVWENSSLNTYVAEEDFIRAAFMSKVYECRVVIKLTVQYTVRVCVRGLRLNIPARV